MKKHKILLLPVFFLCISYLHAEDYRITDYGAKADGSMSTEAIQKLINEVSDEGGGTIVIPEGEFLSGALFFRPGTSLRLEEGAILLGSDDIADYPFIPSRMEGQSIDYYAALINAYNVDNFSIDGPGKIDGNGLTYWKAFWQRREENPKCTNLEVSRPRMIFIWGSDHVKIRNVKLHNSGFWTTHLYQCTDVLIEDCDIRSPHEPVKAPSTDGVDIDFCKDVIVRGCYIAVNDDGVVIKGGKGPTAHEMYENGITENVLIENCEFGFVHATLTMGSECVHAKNITMRNCKVNHDRPLLRLKNRPDTYQIFEDITVENITGTCKELIYAYSWKQFYDMNGTDEKPFCTVRNITLKNIDVDCERLGVIKGNEHDKYSDIYFENIRVQAKEPKLDTTVPDINMKNVSVNGKAYTAD